VAQFICVLKKISKGGAVYLRVEKNSKGDAVYLRVEKKIPSPTPLQSHVGYGAAVYGWSEGLGILFDLRKMLSSILIIISLGLSFSFFS